MVSTPQTLATQTLKLFEDAVQSFHALNDVMPPVLAQLKAELVPMLSIVNSLTGILKSRLASMPEKQDETPPTPLVPPVTPTPPTPPAASTPPTAPAVPAAPHKFQNARNKQDVLCLPRNLKREVGASARSRLNPLITGASQRPKLRRKMLRMSLWIRNIPQVIQVFR